jgi:membrane protein YdbS with pleckstrin-like domain
MNTQQLLDPLPIVGVFILFALFTLVVYEAGFRVGRWWQKRTPEEAEGPTGMLVGSLFALMAFLLAVTMGMAADRFDARRGLVLDEANSIGTTYLRAGFLPEPSSTEVRELLREYVPLRINVADQERLLANFARSQEILAELWAITEALEPDLAGSETFALFVETLNETIDLHESRIAAIIYARVPETVLLLLILGSALTLGMVGYSAGLTRRRSPITAVVLVIVLGAVITIVVDLDRPRDGFLQVSQQPLVDLQEQIGAPSP